MTESTTPRTDAVDVAANWDTPDKLAELCRMLERESASRLEALEQQAQRIAKLESDVGAARGALSDASAKWIPVVERAPDHREPIVYARPKLGYGAHWHVGIAYWTVSEKWNPERESTLAPEGFTHWMPLPGAPK